MIKEKKILKALNDTANKYECSPASIALAWLIQHPLVAAPIASATKEKQLDELIKSVEISLSEDDVRILNAAGN